MSMGDRIMSSVTKRSPLKWIMPNIFGGYDLLKEEE